MSSPLLRAFFIGRAAAEVISEAAEKAFTEVLSELGKFDAEQRVNVRNFVDQVNQRAETAIAQTNMSSSQPTGNASSGYAGTGGDLQATIDDLRAEIAEVRTELQRYRSTLN
jgi:SpoVK/Ycf46/Vps4 family AAA+-type ATPase